MPTTVEGVLRKGSIEVAELPVNVEGARVLVTILPNETPAAKKPSRRLYGAWRGKFPEDFDVDSALAGIRGE